MFKVEREIDGQWYYYGTYSTEAKAQEVINWFWSELGIIARVTQ